jgi:hypothetical protein
VRNFDCCISEACTFEKADSILPPDGLINGDLKGDILRLGSWNLRIEPVVEKVTRGTVVNETEDRESDETRHVEWPPTDENLWTSRLLENTKDYHTLAKTKKILVHTCARRSPRAQPTRDVHALAIRGFLSSASL